MSLILKTTKESEKSLGMPTWVSELQLNYYQYVLSAISRFTILTYTIKPQVRSIENHSTTSFAINYNDEEHPSTKSVTESSL